MKTFVRSIGLFVASIALLACSSPSHPPTQQQPGNPHVIVATLDPSLEQFAPLWQHEIERRFGNAIAILVHGGDFVEGQWIIGTSISGHNHVTPARKIVEYYASLYPGRTIVLLACNTGHLPLGIPGVYYAKSSVWCVPDREITPEMERSGMAAQTINSDDDETGGGNRWQSDPDAVGNIFEFVAE